MHAKLLPGVAGNLHCDLAEALIGIGRRIVSHGVRVAQVLADVFEGFYLALPGLGPIGFATGALRDAAEGLPGALITDILLPFSAGRGCAALRPC
jgi:hypothetical protein